jgi:hypothetical protein
MSFSLLSLDTKATINFKQLQQKKKQQFSVVRFSNQFGG